MTNRTRKNVMYNQVMLVRMKKQLKEEFRCCQTNYCVTLSQLPLLD